MISIVECKKILGDDDLSDEDVRMVRDALYSFCEQIIGKYYDKMDV